MRGEQPSSSRQNAAGVILGALAAVAISMSTPLAAQVPPKQVLIGKAPYRSAKPLDLHSLRSLDRSNKLYLVVDTPYEIWGGLGSYVHVAVYHGFKPAAGARVYINETPAGTTDARGTLVFRNVPRPTDGDGNGSEDAYRMITAVLDSGGKRYVGSVEFEAYQRTASFESAHLYVYTDRGVYNPGQRIFVRAIVWRLRGDFEPIVGEKVELHLLDAHGILRGGGAFVTTAYGTGSFELPLPASMPVGSYELVVLYGGARQTTKLRVERIPPPSIEITHDLPRFLSLDRSELTFTVRLAAFVGQPPRSGRLTVRVDYAGRSFFDDKRQIDGSPKYDFTVPAAQLDALKEAAGDDATFTVLIVATDASGRTDEHRREIRLSRNPYTCVIELDKNEYVKGETAKVHVKLIDLDGVPVRDRAVTLKILAAQDVTKAGKTDAAGIASFDVLITQPSMIVEAYLADVERPLADAELYAIEGKPMLSKIRAPLVRERHKVPIEVRIEPGYVPTEPYVHGDVVDSSGALVTAFLLPIARSGKGYVARGSFVAPAWGTMLLTLFCVAKVGSEPPSAATVGLLTEGQQITVVPNKRLTIKLSGLPKSARPGQRLRIKGRVFDAVGRGVTASVGASVVDAAVLSLLDPLEIRPGDRFYNPELKVLATTGSKILTWPVVSRNWGASLMDIALPPFGFQEGMEESLDDWAESARDSEGVAMAQKPQKKRGKATSDTRPTSSAPRELRSEPDSLVRGDGDDGEGTQVATITLRTHFPETALWIEELEARGGHFRFDVTLPHSITRQAVTIVASDKHGGVGTVRADILVAQKVFARSDLPASLRIGDTVDVRASVHNMGDAPISATLSLHSNDLEIADESTRSLRIGPHSAVGAAFRVTPVGHLGEISYDVVVQGGGIRDTERRTLMVLPAGTPVVDTFTGESSREQPFALDFDVDASTMVTVSVVLPGAGRLVREYLELLRQGGLEVDPFFEVPGSRATLALQLLRFFSRQGVATEEMAAEISRAVAEDLVLISISADSKGGQRFFRTGEVSPYLTGRALEGLVAAQQMQFPVPDEMLAAAGEVILNSIDQHGLVWAADIGWWEGETQERRMGLTAHLFRVLAEAGPVAVPAAMQHELEAMRDRVRHFVKLTTDPLTLGNAGLGMLFYAINFTGEELEGRVARRYVRRIMEARRNGHWEPSWFNAASGTIQATAVAIELLQYFDPQQAAPVIREASHTLLEARKMFGAWHNTAGIIATLRALNALPPTPNEPQRASVSIEVNGVVVTKVTIDPADPFGSALSLSQVDITKHLDSGANHVDVRYSGISIPYVSVERRRYVEQAVAKNLTVERRVEPVRVALGQRLRVSLDIVRNAKVGRGPVAIEEALPVNVEVVIESLEELKQRSVIVDYQLGPRLVLYLPKLAGKQHITYGLRAVRSGEASLPPTIVRPLRRPEDTVVCGESTRIVVE